MSTMGWARCLTSHSDVLRRGAWYPVIEESADGHVVIQLDQQRLSISRTDVQVRAEPPDHWSIVVRTGVMRPTWSGVKMANTYAVCPSCRERKEFEGKPELLECSRCRKTAAVDWSVTC